MDAPTMRTFDVIVGATFTGTDVSEWLHAATIALVGEVPAGRLWEALPAFPTRGEIWLKLLEKRQDDLSHDPPASSIAASPLPA